MREEFMSVMAISSSLRCEVWIMDADKYSFTSGSDPGRSFFGVIAVRNVCQRSLVDLLQRTGVLIWADERRSQSELTELRLDNDRIADRFTRCHVHRRRLRRVRGFLEVIATKR